MKRGRYHTLDNWATYMKVRTTYSRTGRYATFAVDVCDVEEVNGTVWHGGGRRVRFIEGDKPVGFRQKTFIGETAWSQAECYARDWANKTGLEKYEPKVTP